MGGTPIPAARSPADTVGGPGGGTSSEDNFKKRSQMVASDVFSVKILIYKF